MKKNNNIKPCIIGLGYVGLTLAAVMAEVGFKVYGIDKLLEDIISVYDNSHNRISTSDLNKWFKFLSEKHPAPMVKGKKNSLKYISQVEVLPPRFIIFCSYPKDIPSSYVKYIKNNLKKAFNFKGVNIVINLKKTLNPFTNQ